MSERLSTRADDRAQAANQLDRAQPLVSLADMQVFQRQANAAGAQRADLVRDLPSTIDFGSVESLYSTPQETRINDPSAAGDVRAANAPRDVISETPARAAVSEQDVEALRTGLNREIARMPNAMARDITESMRVLENRTPPLTNEQIAGVYEATQRLLLDPERRSPLTLQQRQLLAAGIMDNAARPSDIDQGRHDTCNVTTLEERLNTLHPERAAALVAEVGLTGGFTSRDGFRAIIDRASLRPDSEARVLPSNGDRMRNYASQVFDVAVLNDHYQRETPNRRYVQRDPRTVADPRHMIPTGEGMATSTNDRISANAGRNATAFRGLDLGRINRVGESIGLGTNYIIGHSLAPDAHAADGTTVVSNVTELGQALERARASNNFPLVVGVEADGPMFNTRLRGGHVVSILGYDPETRTVRISNQWGRSQDLQNVPLQTLHDSMFRPGKTQT